VKKTTLAQIAEQAGTSTNTVSLALRDSARISRATREHIKAVAEKLGYKKNPFLSEMMRKVRSGQELHENIGLFNLHPDSRSITTDLSIRPLAEGVRRRAREMGLVVNDFWLGDCSLPPARLNQILDSRGVHAGILIAARMIGSSFVHYRDVWQRIACVSLAVPTTNPVLPFCCVDQYHLVLEAVAELGRRGYARPALVVTDTIERLVDYRFRAAMQIAQDALPGRPRIPDFTDVNHPPGNAVPPGFLGWLDHHSPDALLTFFSETRSWVELSGRDVPDDVAILMMDNFPSARGFTCMDQDKFTVGSNSVDSLCSLMLSRDGGIQAPCTTIHNRAFWVEGTTVRPPQHPATGGADRQTSAKQH
jgi:LacI family transcriptional regulator